MTERVVAKWESAGGAYWAEVAQRESGAYFSRFMHNDRQHAGGCLGGPEIGDDEAVRRLEWRIEGAQPDANKTPMRRIV